jgi:hypothetical protein
MYLSGIQVPVLSLVTVLKRRKVAKFRCNALPGTWYLVLDEDQDAQDRVRMLVACVRPVTATGDGVQHVAGRGGEAT